MKMINQQTFQKGYQHVATELGHHLLPSWHFGIPPKNANNNNKDNDNDNDNNNNSNSNNNNREMTGHFVG